MSRQAGIPQVDGGGVAGDETPKLGELGAGGGEADLESFGFESGEPGRDLSCLIVSRVGPLAVTGDDREPPCPAAVRIRDAAATRIRMSCFLPAQLEPPPLFAGSFCGLLPPVRRGSRCSADCYC
jgi:hypothetical protein